MAKNGRKGAGRHGEVKARSQVFSGQNKRFTKVDNKTGRFIDQKSKKWSSFRGVRKK